MDEARRRRLIEEAARLQRQTDAIIAALDEYLAGLDPADRQREVNAVWLEPPITRAEAVAAYPPLSDHFDVLQGDVIRTEAAFVLGHRVAGAYVVASATCDAVIRPRPRRGSILLLPVVPRTIEGFDGKTPAAKANVAGRRLEQLLTFRTTGALYLPPLIDDTDDGVSAASLGVTSPAYGARLDGVLAANRPSAPAVMPERNLSSPLRHVLTRSSVRPPLRWVC